MLLEKTFETAVRIPPAWKGIRLENVIKFNSTHSLTFRITVKKKLDMNNETQFRALIKAAI